jgi:hypothetical protein
MSQVFDEDHLRFEFDEAWTVVKYDEPGGYYREKVKALEGTKAVDFVALYVASRHLFWIEVKDFRGYRIQNKSRQTDGELAREVAQKVRDSIAGVVGAFQLSSSPETWQPFVNCMRRREPSMKVLLWLEDDQPPPGKPPRRETTRVQAQMLERQLRWLTTKVSISSLNNGAQPLGLKVTNLPGAGQP